ncbi:Asp/Glu racemase [Bosea sp. (in: a-proteobacteria)]|uniref:maleate cis-trans isomerase family protein n=1 Tax=Bosea sp. (in: a-proteobacteria) TaxID=1871050 RepID=UPI002B47AAD9|nr:Asp/Glu racemase [Bosea sp. (in: a-proteobacteria)]WRH56759.1 MAG: Asp/Glu racemase [Bosea sp. (in: a-proteobacteria)]
MLDLRRIGMIVPSSNTTMETEVPALLRVLAPAHTFSFHSARVRMAHVRQEDLVRMNADAGRAMTELMDAPIDAVAFACLVAIMAMGDGHHRTAEAELTAIAEAAGRDAGVVTSAGALVEELKESGARSVALIMPYADTLACRVSDYLVAEGFEVRDYVNLRVTDNTEVGRIPSSRVLDAFASLKADDVDQIVLSACVQMPSFAALPEARRRSGTPITSAAECTAKQLMRRLAISQQASSVAAAE